MLTRTSCCSSLPIYAWNNGVSLGGLKTKEPDAPHSDRDHVRPGSFAKKIPLPTQHHVTKQKHTRTSISLDLSQSGELTWFPACRCWSAIRYVRLYVQSDTCLAHLNSYDLLCHWAR